MPERPNVEAGGGRGGGGADAGGGGADAGGAGVSADHSSEASSGTPAGSGGGGVSVIAAAVLANVTRTKGGARADVAHLRFGHSQGLPMPREPTPTQRPPSQTRANHQRKPSNHP